MTDPKRDVALMRLARLFLPVVALACVLALQPQGGRAEQQDMQMVMPDAVLALERMGEHLKTLKQFTLSSETTSEDVLDGDEKIMIGGRITYRVKTPDRMLLDIVTDGDSANISTTEKR